MYSWIYSNAIYSNVYYDYTFIKDTSLKYYSKELELENSKVIFETKNCAIYKFER